MTGFGEALVTAGPGAVVLEGSLLLAAPLALVAGLVSFASPCVLPLVPGYLGYVSGLATPTAAGRSRAASPSRAAVRSADGGPADPSDGVGQARGVAVAPADSPPDVATVPKGRLLAGTALFIAGFTVVFVAIGATTGALGAVLVRYDRVLTVVGGLVAIVLGLAFAGVLPALDRQLRLPWRPAAGLLGAPLLGATFGIGWTPCVGPTLGAVLVLATTEGSATAGAFLAALYCLGLGLPFLLVAAAYERGLARLGPLRRHRRALTRAGGLLLVAVGVLLLVGVWDQLTRSVAGWSATVVPAL